MIMSVLRDHMLMCCSRCHFFDPEDILEHGYCDGENCYLDGNLHPVFEDYLAL
jgi:hypothetical protein